MNSDFQQQAAQFSDRQLLAIVYQFVEWDAEMLKAVEEELQNRNLLPEDVVEKKQAAFDREDNLLSEGKEASFSQLFLGWICILGLLGIFIGYHLAFAKVTGILSGKRYYKYNDESRENGKFMFYIAVSLAGVWVLYKLTRYI